jgi:hypothetical protein
MKASLRGLFIMLLLALLGCGYRPLGAAPATPQGAPSLAIPPFGNRSVEVGLETVFADALIQVFSQTKAVRLTTRPQGADLVLEGRVRSVDHTSVAFLDVNRSNVRRVTLHVEMSLKRPDSGKVLWKDNVVLQEEYVVDPNYHIGEATKAESIRRAANTMARRVLDKVLLVI